MAEKSDSLDARIETALTTPRAQKQATAADMFRGFFDRMRNGELEFHHGMRSSDVARMRRRQGGGSAVDTSAQVASIKDLFKDLTAEQNRAQMDQNLQAILDSARGPAQGSAQVSPALNLGGQVLGQQQQMPLANFLAPQVNLPLPPLPIPGQGLPGFKFANALG